MGNVNININDDNEVKVEEAEYKKKFEEAFKKSGVSEDVGKRIKEKDYYGLVVELNDKLNYLPDEFEQKFVDFMREKTNGVNGEAGREVGGEEGQGVTTFRILENVFSFRFRDRNALRRYIYDTLYLKGETELAVQLWNRNEGEVGEMFSDEFNRILDIKENYCKAVEEFEKITGLTPVIKAPNRRLDVLYGRTGGGKTVFAKFLATYLHKDKNPCVITCSASLDPSEVMKEFAFGQTDKGVTTPMFITTEFREKMEKGGIVILDEMNLLNDEMLDFLQGLLDEKTEVNASVMSEYYKLGQEARKTLKISPNFRVIGTLNLVRRGKTRGLSTFINDRAGNIVCFDGFVEDMDKFDRNKHNIKSHFVNFKETEEIKNKFKGDIKAQGEEIIARIKAKNDKLKTEGSIAVADEQIEKENRFILYKYGQSFTYDKPEIQAELEKEFGKGAIKKAEKKHERFTL